MGARPKESQIKSGPPTVNRFNCTECSETRTSEETLTSHIRCHEDPGENTCDNCTYQNNDRSQLRNHLKKTRHTGTLREFLCNECRLEFKSEEEEKSHMNIHLTDGARATDPDQRCTEKEGAQFECPICGITRKTKSKIEKHMSCHDSDEEDSSFLCGDCSYQAMNRDQLLEHLENRHDKHICNSCNIACKSKNELKKHIEENHKSHKPCRNYATNSCEYGAECRFRHIKLRENEHKCYKCGVRTATIKDLMMHIREIHGSQPCLRFAKGECDRKTRCWYSHSRLPTTTPTQTLSHSQEDFWEGPTTRSQHSPVVTTRSPIRVQVHKVPENIQRQKITEATQKVLAQIMPDIVKQIMETVK